MTSQDRNSLLERLVSAARDRGWCMRFPCTTCATQTFRGEVTRWVLWDPQGFRDTLARLDIDGTWRNPTLFHGVNIIFGQLVTLNRATDDRYTIAFLKHIPEGGSIVESLHSSPCDLTRIPAQLREYRAGPGRAMVDQILDSWLSQTGTADHVRLIDWITFYLVRHVPDSPGRQRWFATAATIAAETGDVSLNETLVWSLCANVRAYPLLASRLRELRIDPLVARALEQTGAAAAIADVE